MCLVCLETKSAMKDFNLSRHYNTTHKEKYDKYTGAAKAAIVADLKRKIHRQQSFFTKATTTQESSLKASYVVSLELFDIQNHVEGKIREIMNDCKYFSLALDESTDVMDVSQLLIYTQAVNSSFEVHEELLKLVSLHDTTKGQDILTSYQLLLLTVHHQCKEDAMDSPGFSDRVALTVQYCTASYIRLVTLFSAIVISDK